MDNRDSSRAASSDGVLVPVHVLASVPLFDGLGFAELADVAAAMSYREFAAGQTVCREGEPGESLFVIVEGLVQIRVSRLAHPEARALSFFAGDRVAGKLRSGDVIGAMSLISGEPRSATVVASIPTGMLELGRDAFRALIARLPRVLENLVRILGRRLGEASAREAGASTRGEAVALITGASLAESVAAVGSATRAASARPVAFLDARESLVGAVGRLDADLRDHGTVVVVAALEHPDLPLVLDHVDRTVALVGDGDDARRVAALSASSTDAQPLEVVLAAGVDVRRDGNRAGFSVVRTVAVGPPAAPIGDEDVAWIGRHVARTKLGLALGAGGAKGYAHVGALHVLEEAGYTVDYVGGSSIGAIVGAYLAMGMDAAQVEATLRGAFTPEAVAETLTMSLGGAGPGLEAMVRILRTTAGDRTFDDLLIPLVVMTVDLTDRRPAPLTDGPVWDALVAATALAGLYPPHERDGHRLVDGLALVPVPTAAVAEAGADITVSVNLLTRETLPTWPGHPTVPEEPRRRAPRILDTLIEVMDLAQLETSVRDADLADVTVTPRFGPGSWRDFHLADRFLEAGREAARRQLPALESLARPQPAALHTRRKTVVQDVHVR